MRRLFTLSLLFLTLPCLGAASYNYVHNGSFEVGASGWSTYASKDLASHGQDAAPASHVVSSNNAATHGTHSIYFSTRLVSRPFWLTNGTYTKSFKARADAAVTLHFGCVPTYLINNDPAGTATLDTTWTTYSITFVVATNDFYALRFYHPNNAIYTWVDSVQVEEGSIVNAFIPQSPIEVGMDTADPNNNLYRTDTKEMRFLLYNDGAQTNVTVHYDLYTVWNTNCGSGSITTNALSANSGTTINLALPNLLGNIRATCYITNINQTWDETGIAVFPYDAGSGRDTNGILGIHAHWSTYHNTHARKLGFTWNRIFSPINDARWVKQFPTLTTTNFNPAAPVWTTDRIMSNAAASDLVPFIPLSGEDTFWYPETNASLAVMIGDYTNYVGRMVTRYSVPPYNIKHWEVWNEPQQENRQAVDLANPQIYANLFTNAARLIKIIDANAYVVAFGGVSQASQGSDIWSNLTPQGKSDADIVSVHFYPQTGALDPNATEDNAANTTGNYVDWFNAFPLSTHQTWNTETGTYDAGGYHTIAVAYQYPYSWNIPPFAAYLGNESFANETDARQLASVDRIVYNFCRSVGWGMRQFNIQYGRQPDETAYAGTTPSIYEPNDSLKPWATALLMANHFVKNPGLGRITNAANYYIEAYWHSNSLGCVIPIWCFDRGNRTLTLDNGNVALYDGMGNLIQTNSTSIPVTRSVRFLVSGSRTPAQLRASVETATVVTNSDTRAPGLSIDLSPIGTTTAWGPTGSNWFKAVAFDESVIAWARTAVNTASGTNIQYRWTLNEAVTTSVWSMTNRFIYSWPSAGNYRVGWQAKDVAGNITPWTYTPYFGDLTMSPFEASPDPTGLRINIGGASLKVSR